MEIKIVHDKYTVAVGPNGYVYVTEKRKPHLIYSLEAAAAIGLIKIGSVSSAAA